MKIWSCKIGEVPEGSLPHGADHPMRIAVTRAYRELTGRDPEFIFSGWGATLTDSEWGDEWGDECEELCIPGCPDDICRNSGHCAWGRQVQADQAYPSPNR